MFSSYICIYLMAGAKISRFQVRYYPAQFATDLIKDLMGFLNK